MNVIMTSDCISLFKRSLEENSRDLAEISHMDITSRKTLLRELESLMGLLKDTCRNNLGEQVYSSAVSNFQLAIARISLSIRNENLNGSDPETRGITNMFTAKEYDAISNLEKFSRIDMMSSDDICSILMNEDDRIYYLIKDWCTENMASLMGSMGKEKDPDIRGFIYGAMDEKYKLRLQKINEGVVKYLQKEPGQVMKIFMNYENSIKGMERVESRRKEIETSLQEKLTSSQMLGIVEKSMEIARLASERNTEQLMKKDIDGCVKDLTSMENEIEPLLDELKSCRIQLGKDPELRGNPVLLELESSRINSLALKAERLLAERIRRPLAILDSLKIAGVGSGSEKEGKDICDSSTARMMKVKFFQSERDCFEKNAGSSIYIPSLRRQIKISRNDVRGLSDSITNVLSNPDGPVSGSVIHRLTDHSILKQDASMDLHLIYHAHDSKFSEGQEMDTSPFGKVDLAEVYGRMLQTSGNDAFMMCIVGSPLGFTDDVKREITNPSGIDLTSGNSMMVLMDMRNGNIHYNDTEPNLSRAARMLCGKESVEDEHYRVVTETTEQESIGAGIVRKARIAKQTGINEGEVVSVWKKMEKDGLGKIENVQGEEVFRQEEVQFG